MAVNFHHAGDHRGPMEVYRVLRYIFRQDLAEHTVFYLESTGVKLKIRAKNPCVFVKHMVSPLRIKNFSVNP